MENVIENLYSNLIRHFSFLILLLGISLTSIYFLVNRLVASPLKELKKAAVQMGAGNLNVDLKNIEAEGEIKQLALQFQDMSMQLSYLYSSLEQQVEKRTNQLKFANDILTEKKQELEKVNLQLAQASEHKSRFLAAVSHELRTPLTSIIAFSELLLQYCDNEDNVSRQNLEEIKLNGESLLDLINNLLDLAKIEAGKNALFLETMDIVDVISSVERIIYPLAMKKGIEFTTNFIKEIPLIKADPEKIRRTVLNLATNAVKFTPTDGKVDIQVDLNYDTEEIIVMVSDTGIGIKEKDQKLIFEPFHQVDSSDTRRYRGTGLGLALAKELIEMHGGWISVNSKPNNGSTFTIGLPLHDNDGEVKYDSKVKDSIGG
ncbi:MAG: HAMP domain-containing sensor histidine kinase, partial [Bacillota bacterium]|nr:HAMP domain-containing sensor histidine kinase [Bacillota bacterium]